MIWTAVVATFGATFLLVWNLLNWLVGHVRWLPKGFVIVNGEPVSGLPDELVEIDTQNWIDGTGPLFVSKSPTERPS